MARYDVVAVNIKTSAVRMMAHGEPGPDAEAAVKMAVMRRGVEEEFFAVATAGKYKDGDRWNGSGFTGPALDEPGISRMSYPDGPRGLTSSRMSDDDY